MKIILASQSPRRQQLLQKLDLDFKVEVKSVEEKYPTDLEKEKIPAFLAKLKAEAFSNLEKDTLLITADTIVILEDEVLEKPQNKAHAQEMLEKLSGKKHEVFTGICLTTCKNQEIFTVQSSVYFKNLTKKEIEYYIEKYEPFDKAGAYGIQDWLGYIAVEKIEGCYYNVMGLPTSKLYQKILNYI